MYFLQSTHDAGQLRVECGGKSRARAAGKEVSFFVMRFCCKLRVPLSRHAAKLYGRAFSAQGQSPENAQRAAGDFCDDYAPPFLVEMAR
jgi:hypothetical protein